MNKGEYWFHLKEGIVYIEDLKEIKIGDSVQEYLVLKLPYSSDSTTIMLPNEFNPDFREIRTKEQLDSILQSFIEPPIEWIIDNKARKQLYTDTIEDGNTLMLCRIAKTIYEKRIEFSANKKPLPLQDSRMLDLCKKLIYQEIAFVYGIEFDKVLEFLKEKLTK